MRQPAPALTALFEYTGRTLPFRFDPMTYVPEKGDKFIAYTQEEARKRLRRGLCQKVSHIGYDNAGSMNRIAESETECTVVIVNTSSNGDLGVYCNRGWAWSLNTIKNAWRELD